MTATVQQLIDSFDALPPAEKHEALIEILRRFATKIEGELPEETLTGLADELFLSLDREETGNGSR